MISPASANRVISFPAFMSALIAILLAKSVRFPPVEMGVATVKLVALILMVDAVVIELGIGGAPRFPPIIRCPEKKFIFGRIRSVGPMVIPTAPGSMVRVVVEIGRAHV